ncbi:MAG: polyribonucleotide nucleotidyltransferase [Candidatus Paceibacterota bacterium]
MQEFKKQVGGQDLTIQIKNWAEQTNASAWVQYGETVVLATAVMGKEKPELGYFPLTVNFLEKYYAGGEILGSRYFKREGKPSTEATITSRLIDRAIRPRFPKGLKREVQIIVTCFSFDGENDPAIPGLIAASTALSLSDIPWEGPLGAVRMGKTEDFVVNPTYEQEKEGSLDFAMAALEEDELLINMIEAEVEEEEEETILEAVEKAQKPLQRVIDLQQEVIEEVGSKEEVEFKQPKKKLKQHVEPYADKIEEILRSDDENKMDQINELRDEMTEELEEDFEGQESYAVDLFEEKLDKIIHKLTLEGKRVDGRDLDEVRGLSSEVDVLPRTHGSARFTRGQTTALTIATLGGPEDRQVLEDMENATEKRFIHHYNFPPYSAGETDYLGAPGRREIGHGMLAERSILPLLPEFEEFPYTIRCVSEILSSNGSTSQASVCGTSLALMDAGVPIKRPAAGIAIGLMKGKNEHKILTDIQGPEDHHGDMDFKVAGTKEGITTIQMDVKLPGINKELMKEALERAKQAREEILDEIEQTIPEPRKELSPKAPTILSLQIDPDKIGQVIGSGGEVINNIIDETGAEINIEDSGEIFISAEKEEEAKQALSTIKNITKEVKPGETYQGKVKKILDFGALVEIAPEKVGLVHISEIENSHTEEVEDKLEVGQEVTVKVIDVDKQEGKISLSIKQA